MIEKIVRKIGRTQDPNDVAYHNVTLTPRSRMNPKRKRRKT